MGSVKDLIVDTVPTMRQMGAGRFKFSDRYSVFDWGEMPDNIPCAGASRCMSSSYFFERLKDRGVRTHYKGLADGTGRVYTAAEAPGPMTRMEIDVVRVIKPWPIGMKYGYSFFRNTGKNHEGCFVVPLEVIYRNTLPRGSSVFRRLEEGSLSLRTMGLEEMPEEGKTLPHTVTDVSTKFERHDRYPDERDGESAQNFFRDLGGLSDGEIECMQYVLERADNVITEGLYRAGLHNDDGKIEFAFTPGRELMVADAMGTLDECRFTYPFGNERIELCKEIPRQWYRHTQPGWVAEIGKVKKSGEEDWRSLVKSRPEPLPLHLLELLGHAYASFANAVLERRVFDVPSIPEVAAEYQRFRELEMK